ncbi:hypothetical protein KCM76_22415 [Zooshikella marina]|uniref:Uncharacterized protein n=1 Tax=Zooshikella ganghwensis TaxID=202772 RepID=A0A4P9VEP5_9GAMM|nr:hypothetical protein [Zooshikella ganghwensis]MBU2708764.1 hypothetical protein [Zooshikella ganghwensis]RDH41525.1 hypothetical protein B9G39_28325 [Zooshikella ganghwensis]RDH41553.1 hypothetical protein B9G39_27790 [Zooshikella ganghwensis]
MKFTEQDLHNINEAIASSELKVKINGREIEYRSISELMTARKLILNDLGIRKKRNPLAGFNTMVDRGV